ncbi:MAG: LysR family transcriptional regulator [Firmicutes bacterium]|nr:LysR family transcriptional regulator [Bacillota bacterium]
MERFNAEVFITIARLGSYRKAADALGYTQAGISYIVGNMEEQAGFPLFLREFGGVRLTPEGETLLPHIQQLYQQEQAVREQMDNIRGLVKGHIRLISFNTVIVCWLPDILRGFKEKYPGIDITVTTCEGPAQGIRMLAEGDADCGFLATDSAASDKIDIFDLRLEPDVAVVAENHPMADAEVFPISEMGKYPFIGYPEDEAPYVYKLAREKGIQFNQIMTMNNDYGHFSMISENLGFGIYPRMIVENCRFPVKAIPIDFGSSTPISLGIRSYEKGSLCARAFVDYVLVQKL